jgi:hypothetical protein
MQVNAEQSVSLVSSIRVTTPIKLVHDDSYTLLREAVEVGAAAR